MQQIRLFFKQFNYALQPLWNRDLPPHVSISLDVVWPLIFIPVALVNQLLTPHVAWMVLLLVLVGIYLIAYFWVRHQSQRIELQRTQQGSILVAGDSLTEEFVLHNQSRLPVLWAEIEDASDLPGYAPGRVAGCGANSTSVWRENAECHQRGVFRLGPHAIKLGDPFGLFSVRIESDRTQNVLIYPRVVQLPQIPLPRGESAGSERRRTPFAGTLPSASIRQHTTVDSLRFVHWRSSAHRGQLMVKILDQEPGGDVWIVPDLQAIAHQGEGERSTLELTIVAAASLAAELLSGDERRAVGLLAVAGTKDGNAQDENLHTVVIAPQPGPAQLWRILAALAPLKPTDLSLGEVLQQQRAVFGRRRTLIVVAPVTQRDDPEWLSPLINLRGLDLSACVLGILPSEAASQNGESLQTALQMQLARYEIPAQMLAVGARLRPLVTFWRRRTELRSTPMGGVVRVEVEEEVG